VLLCALLFALPLAAQSAPASNTDTPSYRIGATIFGDYTWQEEPATVDGFHLGRGYINFTGNLNRRLNFRITPDVVREVGSSNTYTVRMKYAIAQLNLDEWTTKGSWVRLGIQQTPYVEYVESFYRYRFQGQVLAGREGFLNSSDLGFSSRLIFPNDRGDVHVGVFNGDAYNRPGTNTGKAIQGRVSLKPLNGLTVGAFYDSDHYVDDVERQRFAPFVLYDAKWGRAGLEGLAASDAGVDARGYSIWVTPKLTKTLELLARHDDLEPNTDLSGRKTRDIAGIAYWIPNLERVTSAVMVDGERVQYDELNRADETRYAVRLLINF
jgi:hypothetical protein